MSTVGKVIKCKAAVTWEKGTKHVLEDIEVDPPKAKEVRVKIICSGVCHSDLSSDEGVLLVKYPIINGHEGAGVVESVGEGVTSVQPGDHVLTTFVPNCKTCKICTDIPDRNVCLLSSKLSFTGTAEDGTHRYRCRNTQLFNFVGISSFSEYSVINEVNITKINKSVPLDKVCLLSCGVATGYGAALKTAKVSSGSTCAVWGLGTIGLATVMGCKAAGAEKIYGIDINPAKEEFGTENLENMERAYSAFRCPRRLNWNALGKQIQNLVQW